MTPGRNRKFNPDTPARIDQNALPQGMYWAENRWFIYEPHPEGGRPRTRTVAFAKARLSELHAIMKLQCKGEVRGTLRRYSHQVPHVDPPELSASEVGEK